MVDPNIYKGIEYVQLNELPEEQKLALKETLSDDLFIKILVNGELRHDCIQYKDYAYWFKNIYPAAKQTQEESSSKGISNVN